MVFLRTLKLAKDPIFLLFVMGVAALCASVSSAQAQDSDTVRHTHHKHHAHRHYTRAVYARPQPASYVVDVDTGKVLKSENPDAQRYPASLTKMMTLYLTFDALKKGHLKLDQTIPVSEHAASQPQTNIALQPGERIAVKDAILSIVVRSANDSAVTLGEALGGTESDFAKKMTAQARSLGMKNTAFHNASGLPDPLQHTTARDMAKLGLALRTDFPQYFSFFKTESFTYRGTTYVTHNHVMTRYEGVDGIKTGFIRASGYNVVTSANRDGHHLVAVVMGGTTWRARDDKMIALLDQSFTQLASLSGKKPVQLASAERRHVMAFPAKAESNDEAAEGEGDTPGDDMKASSETSTSVPSQNQTGAKWGIQVGAFARASEATAAASHAVEQAPQELGASVVTVSYDKNLTPVHRAQLINLSQNQAENACRKLTAAHQPCFVYKVN